MNKMVVFSGKIGSGKSSVSQATAAALGWPWVSFGNYVRSVAATRGLEPTRENLQDLGEELRRENESAFCISVLAQATQAASVVVDGVRHLSVLKTLQQLAVPGKVIHVHLTVDELTRQLRVAERQSTVGSIDLAQIDSHITERDVSDVLRANADFVLDASEPLEMLAAKIKAAVQY